MNVFEKVLFAFWQEKIGPDMIKHLPLYVQIPFMEITSYAQENALEIKTMAEWPWEIYKLIEWEDLDKNFKELKKNNISEKDKRDFMFSWASTINMEKR